MSRQPDRMVPSHRAGVVVFLLVVGGSRNDECGRTAPLATAGALASTSLLPKLMGAFTRALALLSQPGRANAARCAPER